MLRRTVVQRGVIVSLGIKDCSADLHHVQFIGADPPIQNLLFAVIRVEVPLRTIFLERYRSRPVLGAYVEEGSSISSSDKLLRCTILGSKRILIALVGDPIAGGNQVLA